MVNFILSDKVKAIIKHDIGMSAEEISVMEHDEIERRIEKKIGKKLKWPKNGYLSLS